MTQNSTSVPGSSLLPGGTDTITTVHLVLLALLAALVVFGIVWGVRLKHRRTVAERELREHNEVVKAATPVAPEISSPEAPGRDANPRPETAAAPTPPRDQPAEVAIPPAAPAVAASTPPFVTVAEAPVAAPATSAAASGTSDAATGPVTQLKGLGPKVAAQLADLGITTVGQIATLSDGEARALDARLGAFTGRMARDRWIEQARLLAAGDRAGFEQTFGRL